MIGPRAVSRQICYARHGSNNHWFRYDRHHSYMMFESKISKNAVSLYDVRDAIECCSSILDNRLKNTCYDQFGVDGKMAEKYYNDVERMEREYEMSPETLKKPRKWFFF